MLLVDVSGSMNTLLEGSSGTVCCPSTDGGPVGGGPACMVCPTRVGALRGALDTFLQSSAALARFGLTTFPKSDASFSPVGCAPSTAEAVALPQPSTPDSPGLLSSQSSAVRSAVMGVGSAIPVSGGTPTAGALRFAATLPALQSAGRPRGVVLITDGLPNCNPNNALGCSNMPPPAADLCTLGNNCTGQYCRAGYLDQVETVQAVAALRAAGVRTAVIVIADMFTPQVTTVMNAMADEGEATACPTTTPSCLQRFFAANDEASLRAALVAALQQVSVP